MAKFYEQMVSAMGETDDTDLGNGVIVTQHPCGVRNYVRFVVRPYKSIREQFVMPMRMMKSANQGEEAVMGAVDWETQAERALDDKIESDIAFTTCTLCRPSSTNDPEYKKGFAWVAALDDEAFSKLFETAKRLSFGGDVDGFFSQVSVAVSGFDIMNRAAPASPDLQAA